MKHFLNSAIFFGLIVTLVTSCAKYDDGGTTFRAEKKIVDTEWVLDTIITTSSLSSFYNIELPTPNMVYVFKEDGGYIQILTVDTISTTAMGLWELSDDAGILKITTPYTSVPLDTRRLDVWTGEDSIPEEAEDFILDVMNISAIENRITRLKKDELWYSYTTTLVLPEVVLLNIPSVEIAYEVRLKKKE